MPAAVPGAPYVLSQLTGSYQSYPDFLDTQHSIETKADADAYLSRMEAFARLMDQEAEIAKRDYADGVIPPDFVIDKALIADEGLRRTPTAQAPLVPVGGPPDQGQEDRRATGPARPARSTRPRCCPP